MYSELLSVLSHQRSNNDNYWRTDDCHDDSSTATHPARLRVT